MDAGDLYSGLELPTKTKRQREEEATITTETADNSKQNNEVKRHRVENQPLDLSATVAKLEGYMLLSKKFSKASALFCQLMENQLTVESSELFLKTISKVVDEKGETYSSKKEFQTLIETLDAKRDVVLCVEGSKRRERERQLDTWKFLAITHAQLFTDETYQFNKAAKVVKLRFEEIVSGKESKDDDERMRRLHAEIMPLLRTLYNMLNKSWATTIAESVLAAATRHRLLFNERDRVEVDKWTKGMQERRNAPAAVRSVGSEARRNIVAMSVSKASEANAKISGKHNHPLFNKDF